MHCWQRRFAAHMLRFSEVIAPPRYQSSETAQALRDSHHVKPQTSAYFSDYIRETARQISATIFMMVILGINAYHANASAAIIADGRLLAAVEEERLNRVKYAAGLPVRAIQYCLDQAGVKLSEVDHIAIPRNPWARLGTKLRFAMRMPKDSPSIARA